MLRGGAVAREPRSDYLLALTFVLALMGYQLAAPFIQIMAPDGSEPAIAVRVLIIVLAGVCLVASFSRRTCGLYQLLPFYLFLTFYTLRLCENFFVRELVWQADPVIALSMLIGSGILPALLLAPVVAQMLRQFESGRFP